MNTQNSLISQVRTNLEQCGYSNGLLRTDYVYEDDRGKHTVALAGFARPVYDSRTSCISVIRCDELLGATEEYVNQFRGFGAPVIFACFNGTLQWWNVGTRGVKIEKTVSKDEVKSFFSAHKEEFSPGRIWRAKNLGRIDTRQQLGFVDIGLMPLLEQEMGERLGGLMNRVISLLHNGFTDEQLQKSKNQQWLFIAGFWLLCAKILQNKGVDKFVELNLNDVDAVLNAVKIHYRAQQQLQIENKRQRNAIEKAAVEINKFANLSNLTTEAFGYMYENVLVDKKLRSALGIHATPSYLVDYIVWQLWPWIKQIPEEKRIVLEPACGHAPFLTGALRLLRELFEGDENAFHKYAQKRLKAIEMDPFAREIARLSLTMADVPKPNGWNIVEGDIYIGDVLSKNARNAMVLLCNPPFEKFKDEKAKYGSKLKYDNKAAEVLWRTLPYMPVGSVFGVVLPRGFLENKNAISLRKILVEDFELREICVLPDNVFEFGDLESTIILGRKRVSSNIINTVKFVRVREKDIDQFRYYYKAPTEVVQQSHFLSSSRFNLYVPELGDVWNFCQSFSRLETVVNIRKTGKGLEYKSEKNLSAGMKTKSRKRFKGAIQGYAKSGGKVRLTGTPSLMWMSVDDRILRRAGQGKATNKPRIIINSAPVGRNPWRLEAQIDNKGRPITSSFIAIEQGKKGWPLEVLWAILNSPLSNAYIYCHSNKWLVGVERILKLPIPGISDNELFFLQHLVLDYFSLDISSEEILQPEVESKEAERKMLAIDAEVMRLYDLPPKMEKRILDLFQGIQRKGVNFKFEGYYPEGFESAVPLHEYLSEEYQRSTITFVDEWVKKHQSPEINEVLRKAVEAFEEK